MTIELTKEKIAAIEAAIKNIDVAVDDYVTKSMTAMSAHNHVVEELRKVVALVAGQYGEQSESTNKA